MNLNDIIIDENDEFSQDIDPSNRHTFEGRLEELKEEIEFWEERAAQLEIQNRRGNSRLMTDKIIRQKKEIRDLKSILYEQKLNDKLKSSMTSSNQTHQEIDSSLVSPTDLKQFVENCRIQETTTAGGASSAQQQDTLKPGLENTADILNAVPPPANHQRDDMLIRARGNRSSRSSLSSRAINQHHSNWNNNNEAGDCNKG